MTPVELLRAVFGGLFVIFAPGFAWSYVFFYQKSINWIERIALSLGLSIALVTLMILGLNLLFRIPINLVNSIIAIVSLIVVASLIILLRWLLASRK